jgi:hypothetical protein
MELRSLRLIRYSLPMPDIRIPDGKARVPCNHSRQVGYCLHAYVVTASFFAICGWTGFLPRGIMNPRRASATDSSAEMPMLSGRKMIIDRDGSTAAPETHYWRHHHAGSGRI